MAFNRGNPYEQVGAGGVAWAVGNPKDNKKPRQLPVGVFYRSKPTLA